MSGGWELEMNGTEAKLTRSIAGEKYVCQRFYYSLTDTFA